MAKNKGGRPVKIDATVLQKLEDAFSNAFPDREACLYAGINPQTLYNYQKRHPEFIERKELLKLHPNMAARRAIVKALPDPNHAWRWLEKKDSEFKPTTKIEHSGKIQTEDVTKNPEIELAKAEAIKTYEQTRTQQIKEARRKPA